MFFRRKSANAPQKTFWEIIDLLAWKHEGDDEKVLAPVVDYLQAQNDVAIFRFHEQLTEYLYALDSKSLAEAFIKATGFASDDGFLYCRCAVVANGEKYYHKIKDGKAKLESEFEFESLLYAPSIAWAKKHNEDELSYPYTTKKSYETGSNAAQWT